MHALAMLALIGQSGLVTDWGEVVNGTMKYYTYACSSGKAHVDGFGTYGLFIPNRDNYYYVFNETCPTPGECTANNGWCSASCNGDGRVYGGTSADPPNVRGVPTDFIEAYNRNQAVWELGAWPGGYAFGGVSVNCPEQKPGVVPCSMHNAVLRIDNKNQAAFRYDIDYTLTGSASVQPDGYSEGWDKVDTDVEMPGFWNVAADVWGNGEPMTYYTEWTDQNGVSHSVDLHVYDQNHACVGWNSGSGVTGPNDPNPGVNWMGGITTGQDFQVPANVVAQAGDHLMVMMWPTSSTNHYTRATHYSKSDLKITVTIHGPPQQIGRFDKTPRAALPNLFALALARRP